MPHKSGLTYEEQIRVEMRKILTRKPKYYGSKLDEDSELALKYYGKCLETCCASASWETFKGSAAGANWIKMH